MLSVPLAGVETAAVALHLDIGSRHEPAHLNGVAHMVEHMVFKGAGGRDARAIAEAIEDVGGSLNAYTARDTTVFHARVLREDVPLAVELIAALVTAPHLDPADLDKEREVVLQELGEARDTPDDIVHDHLYTAAFAGQPLGRPILGSEATLAAIDTGACRAWVARMGARGAVLVAAGAVDHAALEALAERWLGVLPAGATAAPQPGVFTGGEERDPRRFEQAHLTLGWAGPAQADPAHTAAQVFSMAAGDGMSSRLFQQVREERGLAYSVWTSHHPFADTGLFTAYLAVAGRNARRARALVERVLHETAAGLEPAELARARAQLKAGLLMGLEGSSGWADFAARQYMVHGRLVAPAEAVQRIEAVSVDAARAAGAAMLAGRQAFASVGLRGAA